MRATEESTSLAEYSRRAVLLGGGVVLLGTGAVLLGGAPAGAGSGLLAGLPGPGQAALTFDDGPHRSTTDAVLATLRRRGVPATFFMVGISARALPAVVRRVAAAGHSVQVHSWNHTRLDTKSTGAIQADLVKTRDLLRKLAGRTPTAFRPPYGYTNSRMRQAAAAVGLRQVMWNAAPSVTMRSASVELGKIIYWVNVARRNRQGATIILHDGSGSRSVMLSLLSPLITRLRADRWQLVTIR